MLSRLKVIVSVLSFAQVSALGSSLVLYNTFKHRFPTTSSLTLVENSELKSKQGIPCQGCTKEKLDMFNGHFTWYYNYMPAPVKDQAEWINDQKIEYSPMIQKIDRKNKCVLSDEFFKDTKGKKNQWKLSYTICSLDSVIKQIEEGQAKLTQKSEYLMGLNEDWHVSIKAQVDSIRKYVIPAAKKLGMKVVTPTLKRNAQAAQVMAMCYAYRNDPEYPCNVEDFAVFSIHYYTCYDSLWTESFDQKKGTWYRDTKKRLKKFVPQYTAKYGTKEKAEYDEFDWSKWLRNTPIWITEFTCEDDGTFKEQPPPFTGVKRGMLPNEEQCLRASGQRPDVTGIGPILQMNQMPNIHRFGWWGAYGPGKPEKAGVRVIKPDAEIFDKSALYPVGRTQVVDFADLKNVNCDPNTSDILK